MGIIKKSEWKTGCYSSPVPVGAPQPVRSPPPVEIRKMRSIFFERSGWSADTGTLPAGSGGKSNEP